MSEKVIKAALLGFGTVGTGVYKVLKNQEEEMTAKIGCKVEIKKILVRNIEKAAAKLEDTSMLTSQWDEIVNDPEIEIVIELIGGINPAREYILSALKAGKHVVSANKDLIAVHGHELLEAAHENKVDFLFEAAVAGGIPIIRPLKQCLAGNHMTEVMGIVNGTTNFILTKMTQEGMEFKDALALATELGYAEADPTADIEGLDAGRKVAILASVAFNSRVVFNDVYTEGIAKITSKDINYAKEMGLPIAKFVCASNDNKVLYDFFTTGTYDRNREFILTTSPSMDILISSNLERLIYKIAGNDAEKNAALMKQLSTEGVYTITDEMKAKLAEFAGGYATEAETSATIKKVYESDSYIMDTHTAVAATVYDKYVNETGDKTPTVIASTASPYKFTRSVMESIDEAYAAKSDFELVDELCKLSGVKVPQAIEDIRTAPVLHDTVCDKEEMESVVKKFLNI